jgi:hypothetical protein
MIALIEVIPYFFLKSKPKTRNQPAHTAHWLVPHVAGNAHPTYSQRDAEGGVPYDALDTIVSIFYFDFT